MALLRQRAALALAVLNGWGPAGYEAEQMRHEIREALTCSASTQPVDTCHTVTIDGEAVRVRGSGELGPEGEAALAEVIRAAKRRIATEPPDVQDGSRLRAHQERIRARLAALNGPDSWTPDRTETGPSSATLHVSVPAQMDNQMDKRRGFTVGVYFPPEAPEAVRDAFFDRVAADAHSLDRDDWDAFVIGLAGDPLDIDGELDGS